MVIVSFMVVSRFVVKGRWLHCREPRPRRGFGMRHVAHAAVSAPRAKPLKRPSQARARFTVQAIYDAFVRIWQAQGWERLTTRAVALETGISVGTLYEYFPNKQALLSGYVRHAMDVLLATIEKQVVQASDAPWQERLHHLLRLTIGIDAPELPYYDPEMLALEHQIAELKHHRRVHRRGARGVVEGAERVCRSAAPAVGAHGAKRCSSRPLAEGAICCSSMPMRRQRERGPRSSSVSAGWCCRRRRSV